MKKLFSFLMIIVFTTSVAVAWDGDGGLANPVRVWSDPVIYNYDEEVTWYYDLSGAEAGQLDGTTLAIWIWQPSNIADHGPYGNEPDYADELTGAPITPSLPEVNSKLILKNEGNMVYSITLTPTEFFGVDQETILANGEAGYWQHIRLFDAAGNCITNCGSFPILFPHQILLGTMGLASAGVAEFGGVNEMVTHTVFPSVINATTPIAFILNNDELGATWEGTLHFVSGLNGWNHKVDYNWDNPEASACKNYLGFEDIYVFNVTNPSEYYGVDYNYVIDDIQFLFTPFAWATPAPLESEWEFEQAAPWLPTAINVVTSPSKELKASIVDGVLSVNASSFTLYSISGVRIAQSNTSTLSISDLPRGVYIVQTPIGSAKVVK